MSAHPTDSVVFGHLWTTPELHDIFSDEGRTRSWLEILGALARAQAEVGLIPPPAADAVAALDPREIDLDEVGRRTRAVGHSTLGLINVLREMLPDHAREWVYWGATVQDVSDTWFGMAMRTVGGIVDRDLERCHRAALHLATTHRDTVMCGRTHGQPGLPVTFGFKAAVWASELARHRERLLQLRPRVEVVQLGGALGTMEFWGGSALPLLEAFGRNLDLATPDIPWITARDRVAEFLGLLALVTGTLAKIGNEIFELQRPELGELAEPRVTGTVGSITMPHKLNPELSEHLDTLARIVRSDAAVALEGLVALHERDGRAWKAEWLVLPEACQLAGAALAFGGSLLEGLRVDEARMRANLGSHGAAMASEPLMGILTPRLGKHTAHEAVYAAAVAAREAGIDLGDRLVADGLLTPDEVATVGDPTGALGMATAFVDRVVGEARP